MLDYMYYWESTHHVTQQWSLSILIQYNEDLGKHNKAVRLQLSNAILKIF